MGTPLFGVADLGGKTVPDATSLIEINEGGLRPR